MGYRTACNFGLVALLLALFSGGCGSSEAEETGVGGPVSAQNLFLQECGVCHGLDGSGIVGLGPNIVGKSEAQILAAIDTVPLMGARLGDLSAEEIVRLADFLLPPLPPTAFAGMDQNVLVGGLVMLDGSGSTDPNDDPLTYQWTFAQRPTGSSAAMSDASSPTPTFTADQAGSYAVDLVVSDGVDFSDPDSVVISALTSNSPPVAHAGPEQSVPVGTQVTLDGTASSDAEGDTLTFSWSLTTVPGGSTALLSDTAASRPTFSADIAGVYIAELTVNDGNADSAADAVTITAAAGNLAPIADAGPQQNVAVGTLVTLDGGGSTDGDGDALSFGWSLDAKPMGSSAALSDAAAVRPTFVADLAGEYRVGLVVNDGSVDSAPNSVTVTAAAGNSAPVAHAGPDQFVVTGSAVTLDGGASSDADGDPLTYNWTWSSVPGGSQAQLSNGAAARPSFTADVDGIYGVQLVVSDSTATSAPDAVSVTASTQNLPPVANAGPDQNVAVETMVALNGAGSSDADGDPLTYGWSFVSRPADSAAVLSDAGALAPTFNADAAGSYVLRLVVNDGAADSAPDSVTVSAAVGNSAPVADAGGDQTAVVGDIVTLDGSGSGDADGDALIYTWAISSKPSGSTATLTDATVSAPAFTADVVGDYSLSLSVNDGTVDSAPDGVVVTASESGAALFEANCQTCHGPNGDGTGGTAPNIQGKTKAQIDWAIANVTQMKNRQNLKNLTDGERQVIADFLTSVP